MRREIYRAREAAARPTLFCFWRGRRQQPVATLALATQVPLLKTLSPTPLPPPRPAANDDDGGGGTGRARAAALPQRHLLRPDPLQRVGRPRGDRLQGAPGEETRGGKSARGRREERRVWGS